MPTRSRRKPPRRGSAEETRRRLLAAGRRAFAARGLGGVNLREDILKPARVSAGSFYHQFSDKADLLLEILAVDGAEVREQVESNAARVDENARDRVRAAFAVYFDMADTNPSFVKIYIREFYSDDRRIRREIRQHNETTIRNISRMLERMNEATGSAIDPELGGILVGTLSIAVINYYLGMTARERRRLREPLIAGIAQLFVGGIGAVRGPEGGG